MELTCSHKYIKNTWLREECNNQFVTGRIERNLQRESMPHYVPQPETCICWYGQGLGAGTQGLEDRPRERTSADCAETTWRYRSMVQLQLGVFAEGSWTHHRSIVLLLSSVWRKMWGCHGKLLHHAPAGFGRVCPAATSVTGHLGRLANWPSPQQALGEDTGGLPMWRGRVETIAESQGLCDLGIRAEISPVFAQAADVHLWSQFCTSKWMCSLGWGWDGYGFSSSGLCGFIMQGLRWARVWAASIAPTMCPGPWL